MRAFFCIENIFNTLGVFFHLDRGKNPRYFFCMEKRAVENVFRICFLLFFVLILSAFFSLAFRPQKLISEEENRTLQTLPAFSFKSFLSSEYQDALENAAADQLLFSKEIKYGVKQFYNALTSEFSALCTKKTTAQTVVQAETGEDVLLADVSASETEEEILPEKYDYVYTEVVAGKLYKLDESGYIIHKALPPEMYNFDLYDPDMLAAVKYPKYVFFIDTSLSTDFTEPDKYKPFDYIKTQILADGYAELTFRNFEEYKQLFYQTSLELQRFVQGLHADNEDDGRRGRSASGTGSDSYLQYGLQRLKCARQSSPRC